MQHGGQVVPLPGEPFFGLLNPGNILGGTVDQETAVRTGIPGPGVNA